MAGLLRTSLMWSCVILSVCLLTGCGGSDGDSDGSPTSNCGADVSGKVFGLDKGTATVTGTVTLPPNTAAGLSINLMLVEEGMPSRRGVVPDFTNFDCLDGPKTKGASFTYQLQNLDAGSYQLHLKLKDDSDADVYDQTADFVIQVEDGAMIMHDETFKAAE